MMQFSMEATLNRWAAEQDHHVVASVAVEHGGDELAQVRSQRAFWESIAAARLQLGTGKREEKSIIHWFR